MKVSREKFSKLLELYLNDVNDYYDDKEFIQLAESNLPKMKMLLLESNNDDMYKSLQSINENLKGKDKEVLSDFIMYIDNIN